jgi:two-component system, OmpR family, response regulator RegX3
VERGVKSRVLVVEDEPSFVEALTVALTREGYQVAAEKDGRLGLDRFREDGADLVLLDLMLPGMSGLDVLRAIRASSAVPVIVVSAKDAEADVVAALELGADDYVTKPYSVRELIARARAVTRRGTTDPEAEVLTCGSVSLDLASMTLATAAGAAALPRKEFEVLTMLMEQPGRVVPREEFLDRVWGYTWIGETRTLDQHIRRLRRRLEVDPGAPGIETVRGVGYRLVE